MAGFGFASSNQGLCTDFDNTQLRATSLSIFGYKFCNNSIGPEGIGSVKAEQLKEKFPMGFQPNIICAGSDKKWNKICKGDSGAPLFVYEPTVQGGYFEQVAVTGGEVLDIQLGFYARLDDAEVLDWIKEVAFNEPRTGTPEVPEKEPSHKIFITAGVFSNQTTRIIDMLDDDFTCELPDYPINANGGVGGIVEEDEILVCGGYLPDEELYTDKCFKLAEDKPRNSRQWSIVPDYAEYEYEISTMEPSKSWHWQPAGELERFLSGLGRGSVVLNDKLLINGGYDQIFETYLNSVSLIDTSSSEPLSNMFIGISHHCNVKLNDTHFMVTGGSYGQGQSAGSETLIFNLINNEWSIGPSMTEKRSEHGCIKMLIGDRPVIWVVGGFGDGDILGSTEYLDISNLDEGWKQGPSLPFISFITGPQLVTSEDLKTVYVTGGVGSLDGKILQLHCSGSTPDTCAFKFAASNVKVDTSGHIALSITNELAAKLCTETHNVY